MNKKLIKNARSTACYDLSRSTLTWSPGPSLASPRYYSGSSVLGRGDWLISGGYDAGEDEDGDTSELLREGGSMFEAGPGLRYGMGFHCQVRKAKHAAFTQTISKYFLKKRAGADMELASTVRHTHTHRFEIIIVC